MEKLYLIPSGGQPNRVYKKYVAFVTQNDCRADCGPGWPAGGV